MQIKNRFKNLYQSIVAMYYQFFDAKVTKKSRKIPKLSKFQLLWISTSLMIIGGFLDYQLKDIKHSAH